MLSILVHPATDEGEFGIECQRRWAIIAATSAPSARRAVHRIRLPQCEHIDLQRQTTSACRSSRFHLATVDGFEPIESATHESQLGWPPRRAAKIESRTIQAARRFSCSHTSSLSLEPDSAFCGKDRTRYRCTRHKVAGRRPWQLMLGCRRRTRQPISAAFAG